MSVGTIFLNNSLHSFKILYMERKIKKILKQMMTLGHLSFLSHFFLCIFDVKLTVILGVKSQKEQITETHWYNRALISRHQEPFRFDNFRPPIYTNRVQISQERAVEIWIYKDFGGRFYDFGGRFSQFLYKANSFSQEGFEILERKCIFMSWSTQDLVGDHQNS